MFGERFTSSAAMLFAACLALLLSVACGNDLPEHATFVTAQFVETCDDLDCSDVGSCAEHDETGDPYCACPSGYAGDHCEMCEPKFHRDSLWHCVPDRRCVDEPAKPCGSHGECKDDDGVIACKCEQGYEGVRCNLCSADYAKNSKNECQKKVSE